MELATGGAETEKVQAYPEPCSLLFVSHLLPINDHMSGPVAHDSSIPNNMTGLTWAEKQAALVETESYVTLLLADSGLPTGTS